MDRLFTFPGVLPNFAFVVDEQGPTVSLVAVQTMLKMMKNMAKNNREDKFKRVRIANSNFHAKVGGIDGGIEVGASHITVV